MRTDHDAPDDREYVIQIYHSPVEIGFPVPGKDRFLKEIAFLDELAGWPSSGSGRFVPDSVDGYYVLDDEQFGQYLSFRKNLSTEA
jgi:hypothetical protein